MAAGDVLLDAEGNTLLDASGNLMLSDGSPDPCNCCNPTTTGDVCWYQADPCAGGDSDWVIGSDWGLHPDPVTGECPDMPADHTVKRAVSLDCFTVAAGTPGTTTTPATAVVWAWEVYDCSSCTWDPGPCYGCVPGGCVVVAVDLDIVGSTIGPECCSTDTAAPVKQKILTPGALNGSYRLFHYGVNTCDFRLTLNPAATMARVVVYYGDPPYPDNCDAAADESYDSINQIFDFFSTAVSGGTGYLTGRWYFPYPIDSLQTIEFGGPEFGRGGELCDGEVVDGPTLATDCATYGDEPQVYGGTATWTLVLDCPDGLGGRTIKRTPFGNQQFPAIPDPAVWGPQRWSELHRFALAATPAAVAEFVKRWGRRVPCGTCRGHLNQYVRANPPEAAPDAFAWSVDLHNTVNAHLARPAVNVEAARALWSAAAAH